MQVKDSEIASLGNETANPTPAHTLTPRPSPTRVLLSSGQGSPSKFSDGDMDLDKTLEEIEVL